MRRLPVPKSSAGFTLIELLIVIAILIVLILLGYFYALRYFADARDALRLADSNRLVKNLEYYYFEHSQYPQAGDWKSIEQDEDTNGDFTQKMISLLKKIPRDPLYPNTEGTKVYSYQYKTTDWEHCYKVHIDMETKDPLEVGVNCNNNNLVYVPPIIGQSPSLSASPTPPTPSPTPPPGACSLNSGYALNFTGSHNNDIIVPPSTSINTLADTPGMTIEFCVKATSNDYYLKYIMDKGSGSLGFNYAYEGVDPSTGDPNAPYCPTIQFGGSWMVYTGCGAGPNVGAWTHIALTYDPSHYIAMYKDGVLVDGGALPGSYHIEPTTVTNLRIGYNMKGAIMDEVRIYGKALSQTMVAKHSSGDFSTDTTGCSGACDLRAAWHFDEGSGNQVMDASGNGNTGTAVSLQWVVSP